MSEVAMLRCCEVPGWEDRMGPARSAAGGAQATTSWLRASPCAAGEHQDRHLKQTAQETQVPPIWREVHGNFGRLGLIVCSEPFTRISRTWSPYDLGSAHAHTCSWYLMVFHIVFQMVFQMVWSWNGRRPDAGSRVTFVSQKICRAAPPSVGSMASKFKGDR